MISYRSKDYMYSYNKMKPKAFSTHLHKYYEFLYFTKGEASYIVEGNEYTANDGDLFITRPGELHSIAFKSASDYERHFIQISEEFLKDLQVDFLKEIRGFPKGKNNKISSKRINEEKILFFFKGVSECVQNPSEESEILVKAYIVQLLSYLNKLLPEGESFENEESERVKIAKKYIHNNLKKSISLESIAENAYTDKFYLSHLFKKETGITITDYINIQRIALAKKLIEEGNGATKIYTECGFSDYSSFYRVFKKLTGKSPREFFNK